MPVKPNGLVDWVGISEKGIGHALRGMNISYKKTLQHPKADEDKRHTFQETIKVYEAQNRVIVSIDESGFAHNMPRTHRMRPLASGVTVCVMGMPEAEPMPSAR